MATPNFNEMAKELTDAFIVNQYYERCPQFRCIDIKKEAIELYRNDNFFYCRVNALVSGVMTIVHKHSSAGPLLTPRIKS